MKTIFDKIKTGVTAFAASAILSTASCEKPAHTLREYDSNGNGTKDTSIMFYGESENKYENILRDFILNGNHKNPEEDPFMYQAEHFGEILGYRDPGSVLEGRFEGVKLQPNTPIATIIGQNTSNSGTPAEMFVFTDNQSKLQIKVRTDREKEEILRNPTN